MIIDQGVQKTFSLQSSSASAMGKIFVRDANDDDVEFLFLLRNNPVVQKASFNEEPVSWEEHVRWFGRKCDRIIFVIEYENIRIGQVRIDCENDIGEVDVSLIEDFRGQGFGKAALIQACNLYFERRSNVDCIYAHIKNTNVASIESFIAAGFCHSTSYYTVDTHCSEFILVRPPKQNEGEKICR